MGFFKKIITAGLVSGAVNLANKIINKKTASNNEKYINVSFVDELIGENYLDVKNTLQASGFKNVNLIEKKDLDKDLKRGFFGIKKNPFEDGEVEKISINGQTNFEKNTKFTPEANVVIFYHTFRECLNAQSTSKESSSKLYAKCKCCGAPFEYIKEIPKCPYCDAPIID